MLKTLSLFYTSALSSFLAPHQQKKSTDDDTIPFSRINPVGLRRLKRSDGKLELPDDFEVKPAIGEGDCFFDAVRQGLEQINPNEHFTVASLRKVCQELAVNNEELKRKIIED